MSEVAEVCELQLQNACVQCCLTNCMVEPLVIYFCFNKYLKVFLVCVLHQFIQCFPPFHSYVRFYKLCMSVFG